MIGVHGVSNSIDGFGVAGHATSATGQGRGLQGQSDSATGTGVYGYAINPTGVNYGVYAGTNSPAGYAGYFVGRVHAAGSVGIGTSSPIAQLEVKGSGPNLVRLQPNSGGEDAVLTFGAANTTQNRAQILSTGSGGDLNGDLRFMTGVVTAPVTAMTMRSTGNVGIGTTTPNTKLHVKTSAAPSTSGQTALKIEGAGLTGINGSGPALDFVESFDGGLRRAFAPM